MSQAPQVLTAYTTNPQLVTATSVGRGLVYCLGVWRQAAPIVGGRQGVVSGRWWDSGSHYDLFQAELFVCVVWACHCHDWAVAGYHLLRVEKV